MAKQIAARSFDKTSTEMASPLHKRRAELPQELEWFHSEDTMFIRAGSAAKGLKITVKSMAMTAAQ